MRFWNRLPVEWLILFIGVVASLIEALFVENRNLAVLTAVLSVLVAVATLEIKKELRDQIQSDLRRIEGDIHESWRSDASLKIASLEADLREWAEGRRRLTRDKSIPYQMLLLKQAEKSVEAIHLALPSTKLDRWLTPEGHFGQLVSAHREVGSKVKTRRRILFLDDAEAGLVSEGNGHRKFASNKVIEFCRQQQADFGVDIRVLFRSDLEATDTPAPRDLLLIDRQQAVLVSAIVDSAGKESFDTDAIVNSVRVRDHAATFDDLWNTAEPVEDYMPLGGDR